MLLEFCFFFSEVGAETLSSSSEMYEYRLKVTGFDYFIVNNTQALKSKVFFFFFNFLLKFQNFLALTSKLMFEAKA